MSTLTDESSIQEVKNIACERLLASRVQLKLRSRKASDVANRVHVAQPRGRDTTARPAVIPAGVEERRRAIEQGLIAKRKTERDLQEENGGAGVYNADLKKIYDLPEDWKYDIMPETLDGHNIMDFVDPDIDAKLEALEQEEEAMLAAWKGQVEAEDAANSEEDLTPEEHALLMRIRDKKKKVKVLSREKKRIMNNNAIVPRTEREYGDRGDKQKRLDKAREELRGRGVDTTLAEKRIRDQSR